MENPFPLPFPLSSSCGKIQMDPNIDGPSRKRGAGWGGVSGEGRCEGALLILEKMLLLFSLSLLSRMNTAVSSLHKTLYGLSKHKENSTSADRAKFQGWNHLYHEAVALWWILWWNLHPDSCLHAKQMNVHLFRENILLEICLPDSGFI